MDAGEYSFDTAAPERISVVQGELVVRLPGTGRWTAYPAGASFEVPGAGAFDLRVAAPSAYLCEYL